MYLFLFLIFAVTCYYAYLRVEVYKDASEHHPKNFKNGKFVNLHDTRSSVSFTYVGERLKDIIHNKIEKHPKKKLQTVKFDAAKLKENSYCWFGHSTILMNLGGKILLTDPVFFPISPLYIGFRSFSYSETYEAEALPDIDIVLLSHDHYDHFNKRTIRKIRDKTKHFIAPLGVKILLERCGVAEEKITELDWYDSCKKEDIQIHYTPTQHFSGRGVFDRNSTLWGSYVIETAGKKVFFSGDTGYFDGFKNIGEQYGPFDLAFIENGAYNDNWKDVHMFPHQSVQTAVDLGAKKTVPIHRGKFSLSLHPWFEPIELFKKYATEKDIAHITPRIGEVFDENYESTNWWEEEKAVEK